MSKENQKKFEEEIREINIKIGELEDLKEQKIRNRNLIDYLYVEEIDVFDWFLNNPVTNKNYRICAPSKEGYSYTTYNIVEICQMTKVNRKSLKKVWIDQFGGKLFNMNDGETISFETEEIANKALDWLISRITMNKLSK